MNRISTAFSPLAMAVALCVAPAALAQPESYQDGQRAIRDRDWERAIELFQLAEREDDGYADAALYWQAYAYCKSGRERQATRRLRALERKHPDSQWLDDGQALAVECDSAPHLATDELDPELKLYVLGQMMERDPERALPLVMKMLEGDPSREVRRQALFVLGMSDSEQGQRAIAEIARDSDDPDLQMEAIRVLGSAGDEDAVALLRDVYQRSSDIGVREAVLQAWMIAEKEDLLIEALRGTDDPALQRQAIQALGVMEAASALRGLYREFEDRDTRMALLQAFAIAGDSEALLETLDTETDPELRRVAIRSIAIADDDNAAPVLASVYANSTDTGEKLAVLEGLMILESEPELVAKIAREETDPTLQSRAIQTLGVMEATELLHGLYGELADVELRATVLQSMAIAEDTDGLIRALEQERDPQLRSTAIQSLAIAGDERAIHYLVDAYPGADPDQKRAILNAMVILDDADGLIRLLGQEQDPEMKRAILQTLTVIDSEEAEEYLFQLMENQR